MVAGGIFNAFAGAGYLFKMINSDGYSEEIQRYNLAMEQLTRARQEWNQKEIEQQVKLAELCQERINTNKDFSEINKSLKNYKKLTTYRLCTTEKNSRVNHTYGIFTTHQMR